MDQGARRITKRAARAGAAAGVAAALLGLAPLSGAPASAQAQPPATAFEPRLVILNVMPPARPAGIGGPGSGPTTVSAPSPSPAPAQVQAQPARPAAAPVQAAAAPIPASAPAPAAASLGDAEIVARANDYFNGITTMYAAFAQISPGGDRATGKLYVHRPGRLRFDYDAPATIEVVADGRSVAVKDRALSTQDVYPISQTPLKFLLGSQVELGRGISVLGVERFNDEVDIVLEDRSTLGGTSRITLTFDQPVRELKRWSILDPQGFTTTVALSDIDRVSRMDPTLFVILTDAQRGFGSN